MLLHNFSERGGRNMEKKQDSGLSCFIIVMKFHGIPITKEQAQNLSVLEKGDNGQRNSIQLQMVYSYNIEI